MFERALLRRLTSFKEFDAGLLAETLLFYQKTNIIIDRGALINIAQHIGLENLMRLIRDQYVQPSFYRHSAAATTDHGGPSPRHVFLEVTMAGDAGEEPRRWDKEDHFRSALKRAGQDDATARAWARKLAPYVPGEKLVISGRALKIIDMTVQDCLDASYTNQVARIVTKEWFPNFTVPSDWDFTLTPDHKGGVNTDTTFDFAKIRQEAGASARGEFGINNILVEMLEARSDMTFAAKHDAEFIGGPSRSAIIQLKFDLLVMKRIHHDADIQLFQNLHLDGRQIREVINSGERSFSEFLDLLDKARKFKEWLKDANPDEGLVKEYFRAVTKETWIDKLPSKSTRFALMTGAGLLLDRFIGGSAGTIAGLTLSSADTFLLDRFLKGWRPNQFVDRDLNEFTQER